MTYRRLGRTGLAVSPIALGTMGFGPPTALADARELVLSAMELGVNLLDTANCYDGPQRGEFVAGRAESMLGEILDPRLRDEFVLISKVGVPLRPGPQHRGLSATHLLRELDHTLQRLNTDFLDIYMIHWPDPFADTDEVLRAIERAVSSGKIRHFGISNHQAWQVCEYLWAADRRNWPSAAVSEIPLSLLDRRFENDLPFYDRHEVGVLAYQPLKGGMLSTRRLHGQSAESLKGGSQIAGWSTAVADEQKPQLMELQQLAESLGLSLSELAIGWTSSRQAVASVVLGARTRDQLASGMKACTIQIPSEILDRIDELCPSPPKPVPRFER
jgi:L-glyceraldehyde 3-phosphate reductase